MKEGSGEEEEEEPPLVVVLPLSCPFRGAAEGDRVADPTPLPILANEWGRPVGPLLPTSHSDAMQPDVDTAENPSPPWLVEEDAS